LKKVISFERGLGTLFSQRNNLRDALNRIDNFGRRRVQTLRQLLKNQENKEQDAYNRLKQNYLDDLKHKM